MLFSHCIETHVATDIITYKLMEHGNRENPHYSFSILKCDNAHDTIKKVVDGIRSKPAVDLIWSDVVKGIQK